MQRNISIKKHAQASRKRRPLTYAQKHGLVRKKRESGPIQGIKNPWRSASRKAKAFKSSGYTEAAAKRILKKGGGLDDMIVDALHSDNIKKSKIQRKK